MGAYVSLHGKALGFDADTGGLQRPGFTEFDNEDGVTAASTASNIKWRGTTTMATTAAKDYTLNAPSLSAVGTNKSICSITTSTAIKTVSLATGNFLTTAGTSTLKATFTFMNQSVTLVALSTALVQVLSNNAAVTFST